MSGLPLPADQAPKPEFTVVIGEPGDHWLDTMQAQRVRRGRHDGDYGYAVTYPSPDGGEFTMFWTRDRIDFEDKSPMFGKAILEFENGRVWYPLLVTRKSLPDVYRSIMIIERDYVNQANGAIAAAEMFEVIAVAGGAVPRLRAPATGAARPPARSAPSRRARARPKSASATLASKVSKDVWKMGPVTRGRVIEEALGSNLPSNFPVIDRFTDGIVTSIKSVDLGGKTYKNTKTLKRVVTGFIDKLARFNGEKWANRIVEAADIKGRVLELVVPSSGTTAAQQAVLKAAVKYGESVHVTVRIIRL